MTKLHIQFYLIQFNSSLFTKNPKDPNGNVVNLSKSFSLNIFKILNKNLNFCLRPSYFNQTQLQHDLDSFL